jgi:hypothetical protein
VNLRLTCSYVSQRQLRSSMSQASLLVKTVAKVSRLKGFLDVLDALHEEPGGGPGFEEDPSTPPSLTVCVRAGQN